MAEIKLTGINKIYPGGTHAVHDVDLHIADGEFMIMVGPSGCAKSTILRMVAGLEVPTTGTVEIGGRVVNDVAPKDRDIAMVFQSYALYPHMTVRENMAFGLRLRRMPPTEIDQRVAEAARILGLEHLLERLPKAMSGGQRQRVAMGRAIVREPQAFLMDEPLSNLDAKLRVQMRTEIAKLHQRLGVTTMYVTHDQVEAMTLGQRICILRKGVVQQVDTPFQVYTNPNNVFVGGFIGSPGMNFMNGHLLLHEGVLYLRLGEHHLPLPSTVTSRLLATTDIHGTGVIVGIRPEHMAMSTADDPLAIPVQVELTEAMGAEVYAYFTASVTTPDLTALSDTQATAETFVARLGAGAEANAGAPIWLRPDLNEVHLFDPQSMLTMLTPAIEADVKARQSGAAITLASIPAGPSPVSAPPAAAIVSAPQPVIHLHQTFVQPEVGVADPAAIASVFDQPVAAPVTIEPLMPAAASAAPMPAPMHVHAQVPTAHPRPSFAQGIVAGTGLDAPAPQVQVHAPARPAQPEPMVHATSMPAPSAAPESAAPEPAATHPTDSAALEAPSRPRGFAPRYIGREEPAHVVKPGGEPATTLDATPADLDAAVEALEAPAVMSGENATTIVEEHPAVAPAAVAVASTSFRETLARIREGRANERPLVQPLGGALPPRVTLSPAPQVSDVDPQPSATLRVPRLGGDPGNSAQN